MSDIESIFLKKLRATMWQGFLGLVGIVFMAAVPFYFNTNNRLDNQQKDIQEIQQNKADRQAYEMSITQVKEKLDEIGKKIEKIQDRK